MFRRDFLKLAGIAPLTMIVPGVFAAPMVGGGQGAGARPRWDRTLVLVELKGGNDGLNTVIPFADPAYLALRPAIGIKRDQVLQLDERMGLNPALKGLLPAWREGQLAVALGVGYPNPNRSHFRSIEIWETGSDSRQVLQNGWLTRLFERERPPKEFAADGVVIGAGDTGPLAGAGVRTLAMTNPQQFIRQAAGVEATAGQPGSSALGHILSVERDVEHAVGLLKQQLQHAPAFKTAFPKNGFGQQMQTAASLLACKVPVAVIKVSLGSFDTHSNQTGNHARLLQELGDGLAAFGKAMQEQGMWNRVLVMTYSEFGRRAKENGSQGTDHGTAAPHFLLGGQIKGGLYGAQPSLSQLEGGDLVHTLDYRSLYATVAQRWWGLTAAETALGGDHRPLDCLT